jgi:hypothetical protein
LIHKTKPKEKTMKHLDLRTPIWKKTIHVTTLFVLLAASRCVGAAWEGTDDFSSGISTTNWLIRPYLDAGQMLVAGTNGHASFIVPISASVEQNAGIVWKGGCLKETMDELRFG